LFVVVGVTTPVSTLLIVTVTPGTTACDVSITVPLSSPVIEFCARANVGVKHIASSNNTHARP
jgi:hypothetical protein